MCSGCSDVPEKDPILQGFLISGLAGLFGCLVRYFENWKVGGKFRFSIFLADAFISCVIGWGIFWLALDFDQHASLAACLAGLGGNIGSRVFDVARVLFFRKHNLPIDKEDLK